MPSVRPLTRKDIDEVLVLSEEMRAESNFKKYPLRQNTCRQILEESLDQDRTFGFVVELEGELIGFFLAYVTDHLLVELQVASDFAVFIKKEHRGSGLLGLIVDQYERHVQSLFPEALILLGHSTGVDGESYGKALRKRGYDTFSRSYFKRVQQPL